MVISQTTPQASAGNESSQAFFRLSGGTIQSLTPEGFLRFTSVAMGTNFVLTIQRSASVNDPSWSDWARIPVSQGVSTASIRVFDLQPPQGMAFIPAGQFEIGLVSNATPRYPVNTVYTHEVYMDKTEMTWSQWLGIYTWATNNGYSFEHRGYAKGADHPVVGLSFFDALKGVNARSEMEGRTPAYHTNTAFSKNTVYKNGEINIGNTLVQWKGNGYRLPTESEWEKAARGGLAGGRFSWSSNEISHADANYRSWMTYLYDLGPLGFDTNYDKGTNPHTSPVGSFSANPYGLYDMIGNAAEWIWDVQKDRTPSDITLVDPKGPDEPAEDRGIRGGSYISAADRGVDFRITMPPSFPWYDVSLRCVIAPD